MHSRPPPPYPKSPTFIPQIAILSNEMRFKTITACQPHDQLFIASPTIPPSHTPNFSPNSFKHPQSKCQASPQNIPRAMHAITHDISQKVVVTPIVRHVRASGMSNVWGCADLCSISASLRIPTWVRSCTVYRPTVDFSGSCIERPSVTKRPAIRTTCIQRPAVQWMRNACKRLDR